MEKTFLTAREVNELLHKAGVVKNRDNKQMLLRWTRGVYGMKDRRDQPPQIQAIPGKTSREGYRYEVEEVERFIRRKLDEKKSKVPQELIQLVTEFVNNQPEEENVKQSVNIDDSLLKEKDQEIERLKKEIAKLQEKKSSEEQADTIKFLKRVLRVERKQKYVDSYSEDQILKDFEYIAKDLTHKEEEVKKLKKQLQQQLLPREADDTGSVTEAQFEKLWQKIDRQLIAKGYPSNWINRTRFSMRDMFLDKETHIISLPYNTKKNKINCPLCDKQFQGFRRALSHIASEYMDQHKEKWNKEETIKQVDLYQTTSSDHIVQDIRDYVKITTNHPISLTDYLDEVKKRSYALTQRGVKDVYSFVFGTDKEPVKKNTNGTPIGILNAIRRDLQWNKFNRLNEAIAEYEQKIENNSLLDIGANSLKSAFEEFKELCNWYLEHSKAPDHELSSYLSATEDQMRDFGLLEESIDGKESVKEEYKHWHDGQLKIGRSRYKEALRLNSISRITSYEGKTQYDYIMSELFKDFYDRRNDRYRDGQVTVYRKDDLKQYAAFRRTASWIHIPYGDEAPSEHDFVVQSIEYFRKERIQKQKEKKEQQQ